MTHASLKYAQLLTQGEIFQGDLFMPTKYQRDGPKNDQDCVQHSGPKCVGFVDENQPPTRQVDFGEAQGRRAMNVYLASSVIGSDAVRCCGERGGSHQPSETDGEKRSLRTFGCECVAGSIIPPKFRQENGRCKMRSEGRALAHALASVFFCICFATGTIRAQVTASVFGRVEDSTGATIPGASVTVTSLETGAGRTATTNETGAYRVLSLPVGRYEVRAELSGFKAARQTGISLAVGEEAVVNLKLEVGAVQDEVTVTGEAPLVNTTTASVSGLVGERAVKDLPLNGRSFDNLITLNPGAVLYNFKAGASVGSGEGAYFTVAGRRPSDNVFLLNGIEYTGSSNIGITPGGVSGQLLGIDAVREFNVVGDTYSAEYGKRAGAQVSVVTQSGTNQLHGAAFEFLRNSALDARNFFDQKA